MMPKAEQNVDTAGDSDEILGRVIEGGFFPGSPAAVTREAMFSNLLSEILGAQPKTNDIGQLREKLNEFEDLRGNEEMSALLWDAFLSSYALGSTGSRGKKKAQIYLLPFHPVVAKVFKPKESRQWGPWYRMLMTRRTQDGSFEFHGALHDRLVARLDKLAPSNVFERLIINLAETIGYSERPRIAEDSCRPYVVGISIAFQEDLQTLLRLEDESTAQWLQSVGDLITFYILMTYVQTAIHLDKDFRVGTDPAVEPSIVPVHFGAWDEKAAEARRFRADWAQIERQLYDSWGRLAATSIANRNLSGRELTVPLRIPEINALSQGDYDEAFKALVNANNSISSSSDTSFSDVRAAAEALASSISRYYASKPPSNQSPKTLGINVVKQLGSSGERRFLRSQRKVRETFRLNTESIRFFARLFTESNLYADPRPFDSFVSYLRRRGIELDESSRRAIMQQLEVIGMLEKESDSGDAVNVRRV